MESFGGSADDTREVLPTVNLSHVNQEGSVQMVDVSTKNETLRIAKASGKVHICVAIVDAIKENALKKGNVLTTAKIAGIMAAKKTHELIPMCHNINLSNISIEVELNEKERVIEITTEISSTGRTGVEMEALTGVSVAALTVYDMCKSLSHSIIISDIKLLMKTGGKQDYQCRVPHEN